MSQINAKVLYNYDAQDPNELSFCSGDVVSIINQDAGNGWSIARNSQGNEGLIPSNYYEAISSLQSSNPKMSPRPLSDEKDFDESDSFDTDDDDIPKEAPKPTNLIRNSTMSSSMAPSDTSKSGWIRMPKSFMKNGGEEFILGQGKPATIPEAEVEIVMDDNFENCVWKYLGQGHTCSIISHGIDSKYKGIKTFVNYKIRSSYTDKDISRRYNQFDWLHAQLIEKFPCIAIPPLPSKQVVGRYRNNFIEGRKKQLEKWLNHVAAHPVLSYSNNIRHFLSTSEKDKWRIGKRVAEKDQYKNGGFYLAVKAPLDEVIWKDYSKRIDKVSNFIDNFEKNIRALQDGYNFFHRRQSESIFKLFQKIASAIINLSKSMSLNPDNDKKNVSLLHGLQRTGMVYEKIGKLFRDQAKIDGDLVEDNLEEIDGVTKELPALIELAKLSVMTVEVSTRRIAEAKIDLETVEEVDQSARVITRTIDAELHWLQKRREVQLRSTMVEYLKNQIQHYTQITKYLNDALSSLTDEKFSTS